MLNEHFSQHFQNVHQKKANFYVKVSSYVLIFFKRNYQHKYLHSMQLMGGAHVGS